MQGKRVLQCVTPILMAACDGIYMCDMLYRRMYTSYYMYYIICRGNALFNAWPPS